MASTATTPPPMMGAKDAPVKLSLMARLKKGDEVAYLVTFASALSIILITCLLVQHLWVDSAVARHAFGWKFLKTSTWDPVNDQFGALPFIYGTVVTALLALLMAVPVGFGAAIFLAELAPRKVSNILTFMIELLAAVPSVIYGLLGISGSQTGGQGIIDISMGELTNQTGGSAGNLSPTSWPLQIPKSGSQTEYKLNVPYRFFGLSESLSWLAQFESQGFEDISALANLVLLQEMMLGEEYQMIAGSSQTLSAPGAPTLSVRTAGSNETALTGVTSSITVKVTALNYFGETIASAASGNISWSAGQVADVVIAPVAGGIVNPIPRPSRARPTSTEQIGEDVRLADRTSSPVAEAIRPPVNTRRKPCLTTRGFERFALAS